MLSNKRTTRKSEPIVFGDKIFTTQTQADTYVKDLIYKIGTCKSVKTYDGLAYRNLCDVLKRHPYANSKLANISDLKIVRNSMNRNALIIHIIKTNGLTDYASWKTCITLKDKSDNSELESAMRTSIQEQIMEYNIQHNDNICDLCEEKTENTHVVSTIHFEKLMHDFLCETISQIPYKFNRVPNRLNHYAFRPEDSAFEDEWKRYHREHAELRICCASCEESLQSS